MVRTRKKTSTETPLALNLKRLMEERGIGVRQLAKICGTSHASVTDWLKNANPTQYGAIAKAAEFFGVSMQWLLTGSDPVLLKNASLTLTELFQENGKYSGYAKFDVTFLTLNEMPKRGEDDEQ